VPLAPKNACTGSIPAVPIVDLSSDSTNEPRSIITRPPQQLERVSVELKKIHRLQLVGRRDIDDASRSIPRAM
jgi:hypothetical protein